MKKSFIIIICLLILVAIGLFFLPNDSKTETSLWKDAVYTEDTTLGTGTKTLIVTVETGDKSINFTIKTDETTVGEALKEHNLIDGDEGPYGLYVKIVNGIEADYDKDKCYWSFEKDGEAMQTGVDAAEFKDGEHFELVYAK